MEDCNMADKKQQPKPNDKERFVADTFGRVVIKPKKSATKPKK